MQEVHVPFGTSPSVVGGPVIQRWTFRRSREAIAPITVNPRVSPPGGLYIFIAFWVGAYLTGGLFKGAYKII